jgi:hypothetical protein
MFYRVLLGAIVAATATTAAQAPSGVCCTGTPPLPNVVYASSPAALVAPSTGYVLDPSDDAKPVYAVNRRPQAAGIGVVLGGPPARLASYGDVPARLYGAPPYAVYRYRTAPSAKIIHVPEED